MSARREAAERSALARVRRRLARALEPDDVPISIPEAAALVGASEDWMRRRLKRLHRDSGGIVLQDISSQGAKRPRWMTTPRVVRASISRRTEYDRGVDDEELRDIEDLRARAHRLEVLYQVVFDRMVALVAEVEALRAGNSSGS